MAGLSPNVSAMLASHREQERLDARLARGVLPVVVHATDNASGG